MQLFCIQVHISEVIDAIILNGFSLRYSSSSGSSSSDNCLLSDRDVSSLVSEDNLVVDQDWDLYARLESGYNCRSTQNGRYGTLATSCILLNCITY